MKFRQKELLVYSGVSDTQFRHWKKVLRPLKNKDGNKPLFTLGDVLAFRVLQELTAGAGINISHLVSVADDLFRECQAENWDRLEHCFGLLTFRPMRWTSQIKSLEPSCTEYLRVDIGTRVSEVKREVLGGSQASKTAANNGSENASQSQVLAEPGQPGPSSS